jgi:hypothetical protein
MTFLGVRLYGFAANIAIHGLVELSSWDGVGQHRLNEQIHFMLENERRFVAGVCQHAPPTRNHRSHTASIVASLDPTLLPDSLG